VCCVLCCVSVGKQQVVRADAYVAALDVPGAQRLLPQDWRRFPEFDNIYKLVGVPVITVQLRWGGGLLGGGGEGSRTTSASEH